MTVRVAGSPKKVVANLFLVIAIGCLGWCGYVYFSSAMFQYTEGRRFDQEREQAAKESGSKSRHVTPHRHSKPSPEPREGTIGRLSVPRLNIKVLVSEGVDDDTLQHSVGHVPGTALPGESGNTAVAGHRDSFFRSLKDLERHDEIVFTTLNGSYRYVVDQMEIVEPSNVSVLEPTDRKTLTIVTCYPFHYIGPAPRRFIVRAHQVEEVSDLTPHRKSLTPQSR
jgi:sortase A